MIKILHIYQIISPIQRHGDMRSIELYINIDTRRDLLCYPKTFCVMYYTIESPPYLY